VFRLKIKVGLGLCRVSSSVVSKTRKKQVEGAQTVPVKPTKPNAPYHCQNRFKVILLYYGHESWNGRLGLDLHGEIRKQSARLGVGGRGKTDPNTKKGTKEKKAVG